mmetsp:Transcript_24193/g.81543  ORF Transcript_24193/g.81543 Transcript_24193/m.81543 type:complete len:222 (+) Transcript_24193:90-755(+)
MLARCRSSNRSSDCSLMGFGAKSSNPTSSHFSRVSNELSAVTATIGTVTRRRRFAIFVASKPSMPGMRRSMSTRSKEFGFSSAETARRPSHAISEVHPARASIFARTFAQRGESSTTRTCGTLVASNTPRAVIFAKPGFTGAMATSNSYKARSVSRGRGFAAGVEETPEETADETTELASLSVSKLFCEPKPREKATCDSAICDSGIPGEVHCSSAKAKRE